MCNTSGMNLQQKVSLANYSTMGLGGEAAFLAEIASRDDLKEALEWTKAHGQPLIMIGGGSNIIWSDAGFEGLVLVNKILGYEEQIADDVNTYLTIGAGEPWDSVVERSVASGLTGIEALSLIPGTAGATPIQNVGAYGQEISQVLTSVEAYDNQTSKFVTLAGTDCDFSYRNSRFKSADRGRYYITSLTLHLTKGSPLPPFYGAVQSYFEANSITEYSPEILRKAVLEIRSNKLPDPAVVHNTGSFFANPIVSKAEFSEINSSELAIVNWPAGPDTVKIYAACLIEHAGFKDFHDQETGMATWPKQPLVLVNEKAKTTSDLMKFKQKVIDAVQAKFNITLVQEPEMLP